ncbi:MAG: formamidopyrimidine-DNA glycosylase [Holophagales bacterium]|nr:MAG: formamidopyrimidine-DNA glycosylase [Holophagales bacterium]
MPELPDLTVYVEAIAHRLAGATCLGVRIGNPFLLRTVAPPPAAAAGRRVVGVRRVGKRVVLAFEDDLFLVIHLMIAGRLHWKVKPPRLAGRAELAAFEFGRGSLLLTEAGSRRRAGLWVVEGEAALAALDPGGIEPLEADRASFAAVLARERHTLKRTLTDPHLVAGIGNAYSDEILHRARLSPLQLTTHLEPEEIDRLHAAVGTVLREWTVRLRAESGDDFPEKVTAFRPEMAVHGRFGLPCPVCGAPVQRLAYAANEANYCAVCQTGGRLLADRALSRLMRGDWPRTLDELEERKRSLRAPSAAGE